MHQPPENCLFILHGSSLRDETRAPDAELHPQSLVDASFHSIYFSACSPGYLNLPLRRTLSRSGVHTQLLLGDFVEAWAFGLSVEPKGNARASCWSRLPNPYETRAWTQQQQQPWHAVSKRDRGIPKRSIPPTTRISQLKGWKSSPNLAQHLQLTRGDRQRQRRPVAAHDVLPNPSSSTSLRPNASTAPKEGVPAVYIIRTLPLVPA